MTNLVERLRNWKSPFECHRGAVYELAAEAATALETAEREKAKLDGERDAAIKGAMILQYDVEELRRALEKIAELDSRAMVTAIARHALASKEQEK